MPTTTNATIFNNYIDGAWMPSAAGETFENRNPADTGDLIGVFQKSTRRYVETALSAAARAYVEWRLVPAPKRAEQLFRAAQLLVDGSDPIVLGGCPAHQTFNATQTGCVVWSP